MGAPAMHPTNALYTGPPGRATCNHLIPRVWAKVGRRLSGLFKFPE
jgi:hypothetical protein